MHLRRWASIGFVIRSSQPPIFVRCDEAIWRHSCCTEYNRFSLGFSTKYTAIFTSFIFFTFSFFSSFRCSSFFFIAWIAIEWWWLNTRCFSRVLCQLQQLNIININVDIRWWLLATTTCTVLLLPLIMRKKNPSPLFAVSATFLSSIFHLVMEIYVYFSEKNVVYIFLSFAKKFCFSVQSESTMEQWHTNLHFVEFLIMLYFTEWDCFVVFLENVDANLLLH